MSYQKGLQALKEGNYQEAAVFFSGLLDQSSAQLNELDRTSITLDLGQCYLMTKNYERACHCFQTVLKSTQRVTNRSLSTCRTFTRSLAFAFMGQCFEEMRKEVQSVTCYLESIKLNSRNLLAIKRLSLYYLKVARLHSEITCSDLPPLGIGEGFNLIRNIAETSCSLSEISDLLEIFNAWHTEARPLMSPALQYSYPIIFYRVISDRYRTLNASPLSSEMKEKIQSDWSKFAKCCAIFLCHFDTKSCYQYALDFSKELLEIRPKDEEAWDIQGHIYVKLGAESDATNSFKQAKALRQPLSGSPRIKFGMFSAEELLDESQFDRFFMPKIN